MKKYRMKIAAGVLALIMLLGYMPFNAFAHPQNPIRGPLIDGRGTGAFNMSFLNRVTAGYQFIMDWRRPSFVPITDPPFPPGVPLLPEPHLPGTFTWHVQEFGSRVLTDGGAEWYEFNYSIHSTQSWQPVTGFFPNPVRHAGDADLIQSMPFTFPHVQYGAVYAFQMVPIHWHINYVYIAQPTPPGGEPLRPIPGPNQPTWTEIRHNVNEQNNLVLFLTDNRLTADYRNGQVELSWLRPIIDNVPVFDSWDVILVEVGGHERWRGNFTDAELGGAGRDLRFNITPDLYDLRPMMPYQVRVVPRRAGAIPVSGMMIGDHPMQLNPAAVTSVSQEIVRDVHLNVSPYDAVRIELSWFPGFGILANDGIVVNIFHANDANRHLLESFSNASAAERAELRPQLAGLRLISITGLQNMQNILWYLTERQDVRMHYLLEFIYVDGAGNEISVFSNIASYDPRFTELQPTRPTIQRISHLPIPLPPPPPPGPPYRLTVIWDAFLRTPINYNEAAINIPGNPRVHGMHHDRFVMYEVFVADELGLLDIMMNNPEMRVGGVDGGRWLSTAAAAQNSGAIFQLLMNDPADPQNDRLAFTYMLQGIEEHYTRGADGLPVRIPRIDDNKIYFVRVVARQVRVDEDGNQVPTGTPVSYSTFSHFVPADVLYARPNMMSKPPFRIKPLPNTLLPDIGRNHITVEWDLMYFEVYDQSTQTWHSRVGVLADGSFVFGDATTPAGNRVISLVPDELPFMETFGTPGGFNNLAPDIAMVYTRMSEALGLPVEELREQLPVRFVDFTNPPPAADFAIHLIIYENFRNTFGDMRNFIYSVPGGLRTIMLAQAMSEGMNLGSVDPLRPLRRYHRIEGLFPSTGYLIALWPHVTDNLGNFLPAHEPANIIATTVAYHDEVDITPTVPMLEPVEAGDLWLRVGWFFQNIPQISYTLYYSELITDYPYGRMFPYIRITNEDIHRLGRTEERFNPLTREYEWYVEFDIIDLFPDTVYFIWLRAHSATRSSQYSNYITMRTLDILPPDAPTGLGLVGGANLGIINMQNQTLYAQVYMNYIIFEWNVIDLHYEQRRRDTAMYEAFRAHRVVPSSGVITTNPPGFTLDNAWETLSTYILKIGNLEPNTAYFARVKTRLTVTAIPGGTSVEYQYVFHLSETEDFFSHIEIVIPGTITGGSGRFLVRESEWSPTVRISTDMWTGEHDADRDPDTYPLPDDDFEWIYDPITQTLTYRFRSGGVDADGNRDNWVDQRFISWLISSRIYNFTIPFSASPYYGRVPVRRFEVVMPFSVYTAMADRHISLALIMGDTTYTFPARVLDVPEVTNMPGFGFGTYISIMSELNPADAPAINPEVSAFASPPKRLTIRAMSGLNVVNVTRTMLFFTVTQHVPNHSLFHNGSVSGFTSTFATQAWNRGDYRLDSSVRTVSQITNEIGTYAAINFLTPIIMTRDEDAVASMERVSRFIVFEGMTAYYPGTLVTSDQFNKLTAAIAAGNSTVNINAPLTSNEFNSMSRAGLLIMGGDTVTRQEAVSTLVRLYELMSRSQIRHYTPLHQQSMFMDIAAADQRFHSNLLKAADLGFFEHRPNSVRALDNMTIGELIRIVDIIIELAGL